MLEAIFFCFSVLINPFGILFLLLQVPYFLVFALEMDGGAYMVTEL
jgi:hypothetical protein